MDRKHLALDYRELLFMERKSHILLPGEIPVHPQVYDSDFAYSPEFVERVKAKVPDSIRQDIDAIKSALRKDPGVYAGNLEMKKEDSAAPFRYDAIEFFCDGQRKLLELRLKDTVVNLSREHPKVIFPTPFHPMNPEKLAQYSYERSKDRHLIHAWHTCNIWNNGLLGELYFRNFAIVFNNLGLEVMGEKSA